MEKVPNSTLTKTEWKLIRTEIEYEQIILRMSILVGIMTTLYLEAKDWILWDNYLQLIMLLIAYPGFIAYTINRSALKILEMKKERIKKEFKKNEYKKHEEK